jgi:cell wall-associated NlpC family hydrolase
MILSDMRLWNKKSIFLYLIVFVGLLGASCKSSKMITDSSSARNKEFRGSLKERYAAVIEVPEREISNEKLYKFIDEWMGVNHVTGGKDKRGIDCSGFTALLEKEIFGYNLPRTALQMAENVKRKFEEEMKEGDLVFFDFNGKRFSHVGVYLLNNRFVHVSTSKGVIVSNLKDPWYYKFFSRCGSVKGLSNISSR